MKRKHPKGKKQSYDHMMGSPMDVADHPVSNLPTPSGGAFNGLANLRMPGAPMPSGAPMGEPE